jgi:hypothetical protein
VGDVAFPLKTYILKPYQDHRAKGTMWKASLIMCFPDPGEWWKMYLEYQVRNLKFIRELYYHCRRMRTKLICDLYFA